MTRYHVPATWVLSNTNLSVFLCRMFIFLQTAYLPNFIFYCNQLIHHLYNNTDNPKDQYLTCSSQIRPAIHTRLLTTSNFLFQRMHAPHKQAPSSTCRRLMSQHCGGVRAEKRQQHNEMYSFRQIPCSFTVITINTHLHCTLLYVWHKGYQPTVRQFASLHDKQINVGHHTATAASVGFVIRT
jgi:hypothetical protein